MNDTLPSWARKPKYTKASNVVATERGWVVEDTGEVLVSHRNLDKKLEVFSTPNALPDTMNVNQSPTIVPDVVRIEEQEVSVDKLPVIAETEIIEEVKEVPETDLSVQTIVVDENQQVKLEEVEPTPEVPLEDLTVTSEPTPVIETVVEKKRGRGRPKKIKVEV